MGFERGVDQSCPRRGSWDGSADTSSERCVRRPCEWDLAWEEGLCRRDQVRDCKMRSPWIEGGPYIQQVSLRETGEKTQRRWSREEGMTRPHATEALGPQHMDEARKQLPRAFGMHGSADALISDFWGTASKHAAPPAPWFGTCATSQLRPTELRDGCGLGPLRLGSSVTAAIGCQHSGVSCE